jgi:Fic family protein
MNTVCAKCGGKGYYQVSDSVTAVTPCPCQNSITLNIHASTLNREMKEENERLKTTMKQIHNKIMVQWEKDYGSIHSEQPMDAYTVSGFIKALLSESSKEDKPLE